MNHGPQRKTPKILPQVGEVRVTRLAPLESQSWDSADEKLRARSLQESQF